MTTNNPSLHILLIAPACYPVLGAEQIVNIKMLQAFSTDSSIHIDVISKKQKWMNYPNTPMEQLGLNLDSLTIVEVDNKINLLTIFQNLMTLIIFGVAFKGCHWAYKALHVAKKLIREKHYDFVLTKDAPSFLLGHYLRRHCHLPWCASWNDPYPRSKYPAPYGNGKDYNGSLVDKLVISIMREADYHIFPCERLRDYMQTYLHVQDTKCAIVPHIVMLHPKQEINKKDNTLRLIHSGSLGSERDPYCLLDGLRIFLNSTPDAKISFTNVGGYSLLLEQQIHQFKLEKYVTQHPPVSYQESLDLLNNYSIAVIIEANCEEGIFLPTKVSDFMQCQIPILSLSPKNGTLHDLYQAHNIPYYAPINNSQLVAAELKKLYADFTNRRVQCNQINPTYLPEYAIATYKNIKFTAQ